MSKLYEVLNSRGLNAAAVYAAATKEPALIARVERLRKEAAQAPMRPGKTQRDGGKAAALARKARKRERDSAIRATMYGGQGGKKAA